MAHMFSGIWTQILCINLWQTSGVWLAVCVCVGGGGYWLQAMCTSVIRKWKSFFLGLHVLTNTLLQSTFDKRFQHVDFWGEFHLIFLSSIGILFPVCSFVIYKWKKDIKNKRERERARDTANLLITGKKKQTTWKHELVKWTNDSSSWGKLRYSPGQRQVERKKDSDLAKPSR